MNQEQLDILKQKITGVKAWNQWRREHSINKPNLRGADLDRDDLRGADLKDARAIEEQLKETKSLAGATMPDGSIHP